MRRISLIASTSRFLCSKSLEANAMQNVVFPLSESFCIKAHFSEKHTTPWQGSNHFIVSSEFPMMDESCPEYEEVFHAGSCNPFDDGKENII